MVIYYASKFLPVKISCKQCYMNSYSSFSNVNRMQNLYQYNEHMEITPASMLRSSIIQIFFTGDINGVHLYIYWYCSFRRG